MVGTVLEPRRRGATPEAPVALPSASRSQLFLPLAKLYRLASLWELKLTSKEKIQRAYRFHHPRSGQRDRDLASHRAWFFPLPQCRAH